MSAITFTIDFTGTPDDEDKLAALYRVRKYNEKQLSLEPPGTTLPTTPPAQLKASYLQLFADTVQTAHLSYAKQAAEDLNNRFTPAQLQSIKNNLTKRLDAGEDPDAIVTDTVAA